MASTYDLYFHYKIIGYKLFLRSFINNLGGSRLLLACLKCASQAVQEQIGVERLFDEIAGAQLYRAGPKIHFTVTRHNHDRPGASLFVKHRKKLEPGYLRHADVEQ